MKIRLDPERPAKRQHEPMITPTALDWVQTLGLGSITSAVLGAWLTTLGQRRQFRWQIKAQRIEAALVSYTECYKHGMTRP